MTKLTIPKSAFPNSLTALNLFCGYLSIVYADKLEIKTAAFLIVAASIFDSLDGIAARMVKVAGRFGVELDSLADVVSFGAAPSFLLYKAYFYQFGWVGIVVSAMPLIFGAFRLARFNVNLTDLETKGDFSGLPIPLQAITNAFFLVSFYSGNQVSEPYSFAVFPIVILLSVLMVSKIRYNALPKLKNKNLTARALLLASLICAVILAVITDGIIVFYFFAAIVLFGIIREFFTKSFVSHKEINIFTL